jgi:Na+/H+ antiporter NhaD/arsenite permease-like protein
MPVNQLNIPFLDISQAWLSYRMGFIYKSIALALSLILFSFPLFAAESEASAPLNLTNHWAAITSLVIFVVTYCLVISEETIHLRKSKPTIVAAGFIWILVAIAYIAQGAPEYVEAAVSHDLLEFAKLFLFLLAAMTFINTMEERGVFDLLRVWLTSQGYSLRKIFWITGIISFFLSPIADNLTTALLMAAVVTAVGGSNHKFIAVACINIVVAANAGGAFSPFGDITTLMVWQKGLVQFQEFFVLFFPALIGWIITATIMSFAISRDQPEKNEEEAILRHGAWVVVGLFIFTICLAVSFHNFLHLPPVLGMMTGLGLLKLFGYYLQRRGDQRFNSDLAEIQMGDQELTAHYEPSDYGNTQYDIYKNLQKAEWDTLMFFYGIILCVGGLGAFGYLAMASDYFYGDLGATKANILVGFASALIDNIPVMFAVLEMSPDMSHGQWLLVTLTAGIGGSMLSIGSAAGVAVMGQARGIYTFFSHLKWSWAILIGYVASIAAHFLINSAAF